MASIINIDIEALPLDVEAGQQGRLPGGEIVKAFSHPKGGVFWRRSNGHMLPGQPSLARGVGRKRNELAGRFIDDLFKDWKGHGEQVFADCRKSHPHMYLNPDYSRCSSDLSEASGIRRVDGSFRGGFSDCVGG